MVCSDLKISASFKLRDVQAGQSLAARAVWAVEAVKSAGDDIASTR
jgi:hypothetical protein